MLDKIFFKACSFSSNPFAISSWKCQYTLYSRHEENWPSGESKKDCSYHEPRYCKKPVCKYLYEYLQTGFQIPNRIREVGLPTLRISGKTC
jgi:hypothetical protein